MIGARAAAGPAGMTLKAWAQINPGTGAIIASGGVSGVVRNLAGTYTITFSANMASTFYLIVATGTYDTANDGNVMVVSVAANRLVGSCQVETRKSGGSALGVRDPAALHLAFYE